MRPVPSLMLTSSPTHGVFVAKMDCTRVNDEHRHEQIAQHFVARLKDRYSSRGGSCDVGIQRTLRVQYTVTCKATKDALLFICADSLAACVAAKARCHAVLADASH